jgi:circadian clock protein KaiB
MSIENKQAESNTEEKERSKYVLRLFVTGASPNSVRAITNLKNICETHFQGNYDLEIIDVYQQPLIAKTEQLIALPLLIKKFPLPQKRMVGDLSDTDKVLKCLGL